MSELTREEVLASIVPDSTQLNAEDCLSGPMTVTVERVSRNTPKQPINIHLVGHERVFRPCKTCRRILIALWTDDAAKWAGQKMTLYTDPEVLFGGVKVGGLRISHVTGIKEPKTLLLSYTKSKRTEFVIHPLEALTDEQQAYVAEATKELQAAETLEHLRSYAEVIKGKPKPVQDALRPVYAKRQNELS